MKKYLQIASATFQEYFEYRLNFLLWRVRSFVFAATLLFLWLAVFQMRDSFMNYQKPQMISYLLGVVLLDSLILASRTADLGGQIRSGELINLLVRPISLFKFLLTRDLVDKVLNFFFATIEIFLILRFFKFSLNLPGGILVFAFFATHLLISFFLYFLISLVLSITAFWTDEIWATRFLFGVVLLDFFSGVIFPIDIMPSWLVKIIYLTPFPYLIFSPLKIWLGQLSQDMVLRSLLVSSAWLGLFCWLARYLWNRGLRSYSAYGG